MAEVAELCLSSDCDTDVSDDFEEGESQQDDATPPCSKKAKVALSGAAQYSKKFNADWRSEFSFVSSASDGSEFSFYCKVCTVAITREKQTSKHMKNQALEDSKSCGAIC